jgi:beta-mannosidase
LRAAGSWRPGVDDSALLDGHDWWFRCRFADPGAGPWTLRFHGLATLADVWLNGSHLLHSENMFLGHTCDIDHLQPDNELSIRFAALGPALAGKRPRPRWKTRLARDPNLRWVRTTLLGRMDGWSAWAAPVGPWRGVELVSRGDGPRIVASNIATRCDGHAGSVDVRVTLDSVGMAPTAARVRVGEATARLELTHDGAQVTVAGTIEMPAAERWWPHTHGDQPRYLVELELDDAVIELATVGFRTVEVDRHDDGFRFVVNGTPIFCRGAVWVPPDAVSMAAGSDAVRASLERFRAAGMNMVRIAGHSTYESAEFWDLCDELGLLVWQDCMLAGLDPPADEEFAQAIDAEVTQVLTPLQGRPALALVCGSSETYQRAAMFGLQPGAWESAVLEETIPAAVARVLPGLPYIPSSPIGGVLPFEPAVGVAHYFGVGAYERPLSDARLSGVRFASECLAFATPAERAHVDATADPKTGVPRDSGASWDFEDVRDFYVRSLFGVEPIEMRASEPELALDLGRAAVAEAMSAVMSEWRHPASRCAGGLVLSWQDLWPGSGWGLLDDQGTPKAPWYALRRVLDPVALLITDEGLSGLQLHVVNDRPHPFEGTLRLAAYAEDGLRVEDAEQPIGVAPHDAVTISASALLGGFRDLTRAYRFGPPAHDAVVATLTSPTPPDGTVREAFYFPLGSARPRLADIGLTARLEQGDPQQWRLTISSRLLAQWVAVDAPGYAPSDSWFHLAPGATRTIALSGDDPDREPRVDVRALNCRVSTDAPVNYR